MIIQLIKEKCIKKITLEKLTTTVLAWELGVQESVMVSLELPELNLKLVELQEGFEQAAKKRFQRRLT